MFDLFSDPVKVANQMQIIYSEYGFAIWETLYSLALEVLFAYVIGLPLGFTLARTDLLVPALGAAGFWIAYIAALGFGALCYLTRVHHLHRLDAEAVRRRIQR